jgi:hypothetical protein
LKSFVVTEQRGEWRLKNQNIYITLKMIEDRKGSLPRKERTTNVYLVGIRKFLFFCDISDIEAINYKKILICREERKEKTYIKREQVDRYLDIIQNLD